MDLVQIGEMKKKILDELRRIDELKQSMEQTLAGLNRWEKQLQDGAQSASKLPRRRPAIIEVFPKSQEATKSPTTTPSDRVTRALRNMSGEFTRSQLLAEVEGDDKGEIGAGTFSNIFSRLVKKQHIQLVKGNPGQRDSLYLKKGDKVTE